MKIKRIDIELTTKCNAKCKFCYRTIHGTEINQIDFEKLKEFLSPIMKDLEEVWLCGSFGDAIFYPDLFKLLDFLDGVKILMATNGSIGDESFWKRLASYPLLSIIFALDGFEKSHEMYRVGIKYNDVIKNLKTYINSGGRAGAQMLLFKHNENEAEDIKKLIEDIGGEVYYRISRQYDDQFQRPTKYPIRTLEEIYQEKNPVYCQFIKEEFIFITAKGEVMPCCHYHPEKFLDKFGKNKEIQNLYDISKNDINIYTSTIEKTLKSSLFSYIMKNTGTMPRCISVCSISLGDTMFENIPIK